MPINLEFARSIFSNTRVATDVPNTNKAFDQLSAEDQLALLWFAYNEMGVSITPAAPGAARIASAQEILAQMKQMSAAEQAQVMQDLANHADTPICRSYASFSVNTKLGFWYELGELMAKGLVAPIPEGYQLSTDAEAVLETIKKLDPGQQITVLRNAVANMGFATAPKDYTEAEAPTIAPTKSTDRVKPTIEGVTEPTVLSYMENMNADDFDAAVALFTKEGALQPPFQKPIVGRKAILGYMREECQGLKLMPERGVAEPAEDGYTPLKITGKVQTPWFGADVGMNMAWRFLLDDQNKIAFVAIDLLASPKELLNLTRR